MQSISTNYCNNEEKQRNAANVRHIGERYLVNFDESAKLEEGSYPCVDVYSGSEIVCKPLNGKNVLGFRTLLRLPHHENIQRPLDFIRFNDGYLSMVSKTYGDFHLYIRSKKRLAESECRRFFKQILSSVQHCHENQVIVGELKLKKFVFQDEFRTRLQLIDLKNSYDFSYSGNEMMREQSGCPAYVCPDMLTKEPYSGIAADMWSLGVILYTMLTGRYPFYAPTPQGLFMKIRKGEYHMPEEVSSLAKSLISCLLNVNPSYRLNARATLEHPWFKATVLEQDNHNNNICTVPTLSPKV